MLFKSVILLFLTSVSMKVQAAFIKRVTGIRALARLVNREKASETCGWGRKLSVNVIREDNACHQMLFCK